MRPFLLTLLLAFWSTGAATGAESPPASRIPLLYCSDLFHPHDDPDDHFDLATLYAIPEFDVRGIVLDQGALQVSRPGSIPVAQLNALTGRNIPAAIGLASKLSSPTDPGLDQPDQFQGGVRLILDTLRTATGRVDIIAVGSMRDLTAAFNREPNLFRARAGRLLVFIGEASDPGFREHNVSLDPHAFVGLMRSGLDLYWVPCFDGGLWRNHGRASFWQATHAELLRTAPPELVQFFIYALDKETSDPLAFLRQSVDPARRAALFGQTRNLWGTAVFQALTVPGQPAGNAFEFESVKISVGDDGVVRAPVGVDSTTVHRFKVRALSSYGTEMTRATAEILGRTADPDFGPNVLLFDPAQPGMQERIDAVFKQQERAQFGRGRHALLFKPGSYDLDVPVGFYTHVAGLGTLPSDVTIRGQVWTDAAWMNRNATCNFWRTVENLTVVPTNGVNVWAVSQAAPLRRTHIRGDLHFWSGGWSSGGFMADCRIDGTVQGRQPATMVLAQQRMERLARRQLEHGVPGLRNPPPGDWPEPAVTRIDQYSARPREALSRDRTRPLVRESAAAAAGADLRRELGWTDAQATAVPIESFHLAKAGTDTAATHQRRLARGRNICSSPPGSMRSTTPSWFPRPNTVVFGLGFPSLVPDDRQNGAARRNRRRRRRERAGGRCQQHGDGDAGAIRSAGSAAWAGRKIRLACTTSSAAWVATAPARRKPWSQSTPITSSATTSGSGAQITALTSVGRRTPATPACASRATTSPFTGCSSNTPRSIRHSGTVIAAGFTSTRARCPTIRPSQEAWRSADGDGFASYKVGDQVKTHDAWGLASIMCFRRPL